MSGGSAVNSNIIVQGDGSFGWGDNISLNADFSAALGTGLILDPIISGHVNCFAIGENITIDATRAMALGYGLTNNVTNSIVIGGSISSSSTQSITLGWINTGLIIEANQVSANQKLLAIAGDITRAGFYLKPQALPVNAVLGDVVHNDNQNTIQAYLGDTVLNGVWNAFSGTMFTQNNVVTVGNTATLQQLDGSGVGTLTLSQNYLKSAKTVRINFRGYHSSINGANGNLTVSIRFGSTIVLTGTVAGSNATNRMFEGRADITCVTTGSSGTVRGQGIFCELGNTSTFNPLIATGGIASTTTINTTVDQAISVKVQWATANVNNTISCTNLIVEVLN